MAEPFALLDDNYRIDGKSYLFTEPVGWVNCHDLSDAQRCLDEIEAFEGFAVGFISYEFARSFGYFAKPVSGHDLPYLQFGLFEKREVLDTAQCDAFLEENFTSDPPMICDIEPQTSPAEYAQAIAEIKAELEAGNTYQVNYTFENQLKKSGCSFRLYDALRRAQPIPYGAFLNFPDREILSRSPELFFEKRGERITCKPMKGTEPRGNDRMQDQEYRAHLVASPKQRAENLMIVDLIRNDLSRIAELGSVEVKKLYEVESYKTVHQMTSTIEARVLDKSFFEILEALFPCGSITGAPKHITTQIIERLEPHSRGVYCGAIGVVHPNGDMNFNVPIRTLVLQENDGQFHIGGGVVYDSVDEKEYEEARLKGKFLFDLPSEERVIDAHYYAPDVGARHLPLHLSRLENTAKAMGYAFDENAVKSVLDGQYAKLCAPSKIRIELAKSGEVVVEAAPLEAYESEMRVRLSAKRTHSTDPMFRYKTTSRALYNSEMKRARVDGFYEVIFANELGHLTEGAIHNLVLRFGDDFYTPPLEAGLLDGVGRRVFLDENPNTRVENLPISALKAADEILLVSSLRGVVRVFY